RGESPTPAPRADAKYPALRTRERRVVGQDFRTANHSVRRPELPPRTLTRRPRTFAAAAALVTAAIAVPAAFAHAHLVSPDPGDGAVLARAPARATLVFDDDVHVQGGTTVVANAGKKPVAGEPHASGRTGVIPLR